MDEKEVLHLRDDTGTIPNKEKVTYQHIETVGKRYKYSYVYKNWNETVIYNNETKKISTRVNFHGVSMSKSVDFNQGLGVLVGLMNELRMLVKLQMAFYFINLREATNTLKINEKANYTYSWTISDIDMINMKYEYEFKQYNDG